MKAVVHHGKSGMDGVRAAEVEDRKPGIGEVKVRLKTAGLNHRDLFVPNRHKPEDPPVVLGSDGAGIVEEIGEGVESVTAGTEVIINPGLGWPNNAPAPPKGFEILGLPDDGTFAESVIVPAKNVVAKPASLSWEEAGVLPLGALTAYRALFTRGKLAAGQTVFIPGIGSGVATFLLQMGKAAGAKVVVSSRSEEKLQAARRIGADICLHNDEDWCEALKEETVALVIDSVGAATFQRSLDVLEPGGTMVVFGASAGDQVSLNLREFFYGQYNLLGSTMGSAEEFHEMLDFVERHDIKPIIDRTFELQTIHDAFKRLQEAEQFGKIVISIH
ncbi:MAG TPA: zinc-binding dehydrogenase [Bacillales bacterium]|nr:zinc-binding dehydrogenase [Bacillales bacterium]